MKQEEINGEVAAFRNLLEQNDYIGRKVAFEVAALFKAQFPNVSMPIYEKYLETESQAESFRASIETLKNTVAVE